MIVDDQTLPAGRPNLTRFAWLSIGAAIATIALKFGAYLLTGSVGLLSDAAESIVNLVAAIVALVALSVAAQPFDEKHHFGHAKAEYFSAALEGIMIFVAAAFILWTSVERLLNPAPLENVGAGLIISVVASLINGTVAWVLIRAGRKHNSITLVADGKHLLTDVWTSVGVVLGVLLVGMTQWLNWGAGWLRLDPVVAFLVGLNIIWTGWHLISDSIDGLMDHALDPKELEQLQEILDEFESPSIRFHTVQTRVAGHQRFISMHVLVPGSWTVQQGHNLLESIEQHLKARFDHAEILTHIEPMEDMRSYEMALPGLASRNGATQPPSEDSARQ